MARALTGMAAIAVSAVALGQAVDLVGYGTVGMAPAEGAAVFACESEPSADRLLSKLRPDFVWDRLSGGRQVEASTGVPTFVQARGGTLVFARRGSAIYALGGDSPTAVLARLRALGLGGTDTHFTPAARHPRALDFFDLQPISMYYLTLNVRDLAKGWERYHRQMLQRSPDYWARFGFGWAGFGPYRGADNPVDGAPHTFPHDVCVELAKARDLSAMFHVGQYWAPWWLRNRQPRDIVQGDPYAISGWGPLGAMAGTHLSQSATGAAYA